MAKSNGIKSLKQAAKLLNKHSPDGESLAYINKDEAKLLRSHGGSGIMTVAGVPSYIDWGKWIDYGKKALEYLPAVGDIFKMSRAGANTNQPFIPSTGTEYSDKYWQTPMTFPSDSSAEYGGFTPTDPALSDTYGGANPFWEDIGGSIMQSGKKFLKDRYGGVEGIKQGGKDVMATLAFLKGKKDTEGLNADEMKVFDELNQRTEAARAEFQANIAGGGATNIPTDVSRFTEVDLPDMITTPTAAEGGRIGAFNGGIQGLMPQQGMPQQGMPQQGMPQQGMPQPGLDPRIGYNRGRVVNPGGYAGEEWITQKNDYDLTNLKDPFVPGRIDREGEGFYQDDLTGVRDPFQTSPEMIEIQKDYDIESMRDPFKPSEIQKLVQEIMKVYENIEVKDAIALATKILQENQITGQAQGGRIGAQGGGIMPLLDMGGMEKDYRQDGGFVPIGRKEKADDVPARLSKNEFVFTADAVKAAGGGDIDQGAQRMYNVMKNLEAGGEISEQSQGQV